MQAFDYPSAAAEKRLERIRGRIFDYPRKDFAAVSRILADVRRRGDAALVDYTRRFDAPGFRIEDLRVGPAEFRRAASAVDRVFKRALGRAADQITDFHRRQLRASFFSFERPGTLLGQMVLPAARAGVYVPGGRGGKTPLVSSVLMGAIPARVAGVGEVVMATPPMADGTVSPYLLAAAARAGVDAVYKVGSAWAVAALAYGTQSLGAVDVIVGPGNLYVTLAKKIVAGTVGTDIVAGPSEILVIADGSADPGFIAADLLSQAEHDPMASAVLVTPEAALARAVREALGAQLEKLGRADIARRALSRYGAVFVVADLPAAFALANRLAPEHLELHVAEPFAHLGAVRNAGAVFLGPYTPEPVGDYIAGPNHVLPTAGTARFASALSVDHFLKRTSVLQYSEAALRREAPDILRLAEVEGLDAHAAAVRMRLERRRGGPPAAARRRPSDGGPA
jgi:histidinol dehydrogenase